MTKKNDEEKTENKEPVSSLSSTESVKEEKTPTEVPPIKEVLREPDREKSKLTEILLILIIILLGATSVYFYQANERLTEKYNSLSKGLEDNSGSLTILEKSFNILKSEKDNSKEVLEQVKRDINGLLQTDETMKERMYNLSEGQRGNLQEISRIVHRISSTEKDESISELKKALIIVNGIKRKSSETNAHMIGEKLESDIISLITEISNEGRAPVVTQTPVVKPEVKPVETPAIKVQEEKPVAEETKKMGFGKIELEEATPEQEEPPVTLPVADEKAEPTQEQPSTTSKE